MAIAARATSPNSSASTIILGGAPMSGSSHWNGIWCRSNKTDWRARSSRMARMAAWVESATAIFSSFILVFGRTGRTGRTGGTGGKGDLYQSKWLTFTFSPSFKKSRLHRVNASFTQAPARSVRVWGGCIGDCVTRYAFRSFIRLMVDGPRIMVTVCFRVGLFFISAVFRRFVLCSSCYQCNMFHVEHKD